MKSPRALSNQSGPATSGSGPAKGIRTVLSGGLVFAWSGWLIAAVLALVVLPRIFRHTLARSPSRAQAEWAQILAAKKTQLQIPWKDARPEVLMIGDSHIERGDWYELFHGALALRNCGLSRAKIGDVTALLSAIPDRSPKCVVLMCGFNDIASGDPAQECVRDYEKLLQAVRALHPGAIVVLSVLPFRQSIGDLSAWQINRSIGTFNKQLEKLCAVYNAQFVNAAELMTHGGGLPDELTVDGLHLNGAGYQTLAEILARTLLARTEPVR